MSPDGFQIVSVLKLGDEIYAEIEDLPTSPQDRTDWFNWDV